MNMIKVQYIGKKPWVICPFNGKKYVFRRRGPVSVIPVEVFSYFSTIPEFAGTVVPVVEKEQVKTEPVKKLEIKKDKKK